MKNRSILSGAAMPPLRIFFLFLLAWPSLLTAQNPADAEGDAPLLQSSPSVLQIPLQIRGSQTLLEAGDATEGDYLAEVKFTPDGASVWVVNRSTNNITVFDWASQSVLSTIEVGSYPTDVAFSDELAVVPCLNSNEVYLLNWSTYEQLAVLETAAQPAKVKISRDHELAVVGCDEADVAEVIDLQTLEIKYSIPDFPVYISKFAFITSNPRSSVYWSGFELSPDHSHLFNGAGSDGLRIYDLQSGDLVSTLPEVVNAAELQLSGDGTYLLGVTTGNNGVISKIDVAGLMLVNQTVLTDHSIWSSYSPPAVNWTGSRVFVPCNPGNTALIDTEAMTFQTIATGNSPDWVGQSSNYEYALASDYYQAVVDFETGAILSSFNGYSIQNGAVSPANNRVVATDPLRYESLHFFEFESPTAYNWLGEQPSGSALEGDATYSVNFSPDGKYLAAVNALSGTLSFFDVELEEQVSILPLGSAETYQIDFTSDSKYAVVAKRLEDLVSIIDIESLEVVAEVSSGGSKPDQVFVVPGDQYAYALNAGSPDRIGVIVLAGANSYLQSTFNVGNMGISWINYGIRADLKFDPTGNYAFLAAPFDEAVQVIDLNAHTVVSSMDVEGFPLQLAVGNETTLGFFSAVTLRNSDGIAIINGSGPSASNIGSFSFGEAPTQIAYDAANEGFVVLSNTEKSVQTYSLEALDFIDEVIYTDHTPIGVKVAEDGRKFILLRSDDVATAPHYLQIDTAFYELPSTPIQHMAINAAGTLAAVAFPGSDQVLLFKDDAVLGWKVQHLGTSAKTYRILGNPVGAEMVLAPIENGYSEPTECWIHSAAGQVVWQQQVAPGETIRISRPANWTAGIYYYSFRTKAGVLESGRIVVP